MSSYRAAYTDLEVNATTVVGTTLSGNTTQVGTEQIGRAETATDFAPVSSGSPAAIGRSVYLGDSATGAGSAAWIVFPGITFAAAPRVVLQNNQAAGVTFFVPAGSLTAGSFYVQSSAASASFTYIAIGSGRTP